MLLQHIMAKMMIKVICLLTISYIHAQTYVQPGDDCADCTLQTETALDCVRNMIKKIEPYEANEVNPCKKCTINGLSDFQLTQGTNVCNQNTPDGGKQTTFQITFNKITVDCICELDCNLPDIGKAASQALNSDSSKDCPKEKQGEASDAIKQSRSGIKSFSQIMNLRKCKSGSAFPMSGGGGGGGGGFRISGGSGGISGGSGGISGGSGGISGGSGGVSGGSSGSRLGSTTNSCKKSTGHLIGEWVNLQARFSTVRKPGENKINIGNALVTTKEDKGLTMRCESDDSKFKTSCDCLVATGYPKDLVVKGINMIFPCKISQQAEKYEDVVQFFKCDEDEE